MLQRGLFHSSKLVRKPTMRLVVNSLEKDSCVEAWLAHLVNSRRDFLLLPAVRIAEADGCLFHVGSPMKRAVILTKTQNEMGGLTLPRLVLIKTSLDHEMWMEKDHPSKTMMAAYHAEDKVAKYLNSYYHFVEMEKNKREDEKVDNAHYNSHGHKG